MAKKKEEIKKAKPLVVKEAPIGGKKYRYKPITCMIKQMDKPFIIDGYEYEAGDYICYGKGNGPVVWFHGLTKEQFKFYKEI